MATPTIYDELSDFRTFKYNYQYWKDFITAEPISSDLREKVRLDLRKQWYSDRLWDFRMCIHANWTRNDSEKILLDSELGEINSLTKARFCCNRPSGFYWCRDLQRAAARENFDPTPTAIFANIFGEWHKQYDNQPNIEFGHFVANPIRVTERGPDTISGIVKAHIWLCEKAKEVLQDPIQEENRLYSSALSKQDRDEAYKIHPLYPALVLVVDRYELRDPFYNSRRPDGYIRLQDTAHFQSVLIVRTGIEDHLSAPISFKSLHDSILPLERVDFDGRVNIDVIRVPLPDAVRFVVDLEKREEAVADEKMAAPSTGRERRVMCDKVFTTDKGLCGDQFEWSDRHIAAAEEHGYQHCEHTARALRRVQAEMKDEIYDLLSPLWFNPKWIDYEGELGPQL